MTEEVASVFTQEYNNGGVNMISWGDIEEALENDENLYKLRNALINGDSKTVKECTKRHCYIR